MYGTDLKNNPVQLSATVVSPAQTTRQSCCFSRSRSHKGSPGCSSMTVLSVLQHLTCNLLRTRDHTLDSSSAVATDM